MPGLTKGLSFHNFEAFVRRTLSDDAWQQLVDALDQSERAQVAAMVSVGWYSLDLYAHLLGLLNERYETEQPRILEQYGRFAAEQDLTTVHKLILKLASPGLILDQSSKLWSKFHDTGEWSVTLADRRAAGTLTGWGCIDRNLCREMVGYIETMIALGHGKNVRVQHNNCRAHGADACVFEATWR